MAYSYSQLQDIKARIVRDLAAQQGQLATAKAAFAGISRSLVGMQSTYAEWASEVNAYATANPTDPAVLALKAERDRLVSEFASTKSQADTLNTAVNG